MKKTSEYFINKRNRISAAIYRVKNILKEHEQGIRDKEAWNLAYDLDDRLCRRYWNNECDFGTWNFENYGIDIISFK